MYRTMRWAVAATTLALLGGCGQDAPAADAAATGHKVWQGVATDCPPLTAPAFAGLEPSPSSEKIDREGVLSIMCMYGTADTPPTLLVHIRVNRSPDLHGEPAEMVRGSRQYAQGSGYPVIELSNGGVLAAESSGSAEAVVASGNASLTVMAQLEIALNTEAELVAHRAEFEQSLNDLVGNLR
ncbi:hypothetical protein AB0F72_33900 [Actinoplanes sp. NPDC023936]|uniref:hypothetical protein n=1 Tax=Actinoplanes sp. NPDC023936 TaxID=3154910 RepID=UPI0033F7369C